MSKETLSWEKWDSCPLYLTSLCLGFLMCEVEMTLAMSAS